MLPQLWRQSHLIHDSVHVDNGVTILFLGWVTRGGKTTYLTDDLSPSNSTDQHENHTDTVLESVGWADITITLEVGEENNKNTSVRVLHTLARDYNKNTVLAAVHRHPPIEVTVIILQCKQAIYNWNGSQQPLRYAAFSPY